MSEPPHRPFSVGFAVGGQLADMLAKAQVNYFAHQDLYYGDPEYRALDDARRRLRALRYDEDDEARLSDMEARTFRLLATLRRLNANIAGAKCCELCRRAVMYDEATHAPLPPRFPGA